jgi:hypothetical protein
VQEAKPVPDRRWVAGGDDEAVHPVARHRTGVLRRDHGHSRRHRLVGRLGAPLDQAGQDERAGPGIHSGGASLHVPEKANPGTIPEPGQVGHEFVMDLPDDP